ncbi:hypothetical protein [Mycetohabitans endofungorum]
MVTDSRGDVWARALDVTVESGIRRLDVVEVLDFLHALESDPHDFIKS